jgi:hypothetical protein
MSVPEDLPPPLLLLLLQASRVLRQWCRRQMACYGG